MTDQRYATGSNDEEMWSEREQALRDVAERPGTLALKDALSLLDQERERVDMAEKVVEGTLHHLVTCREQVAELLEALEQTKHWLLNYYGVVPQDSEAVALENHVNRVLAKHKERV